MDSASIRSSDPLKNRELSTVNALAQALSQSLDLESSLDTTLEKVAELLELETGWVWLLDENTGEGRLAAARSLPPGLRDHPEAMQGSCYCLDTYRAGDLRGAANVNVVWCSRLAKLVEGTDGLQCHASVPLYANGRKLGILNVADRDWRELTGAELELLYTVGALVSLAVERTRLAATGARLAAVEERNRLAREIHDTLAQSLAAITLQLETADALVESENLVRLVEPVRRALTLARSTLDEARRSVVELRAAPLGGRSLGDALASLGKEHRDAAGRVLDVQVVCEGERSLPPALELGLYRIASEALANVARHANATAALVRLACGPGQVHLRIEDDGRGFDPAGVPAGRFGLVGMNERARLLGGTLSVDSALGQGTVIEVAVPLV